MIRSMIRRARGVSGAIPLCGALLSLTFIAACDSGKPPEPVVPVSAAKPAAIVPSPDAQPAPVETPAQAPQKNAKQVSDAALAQRVKAALDAEPQIHGFTIDVTADNGKVALFGTVQTKARRDKAEQVTRGVSGVKSVDNNLAIVAGS